MKCAWATNRGNCDITFNECNYYNKYSYSTLQRLQSASTHTHTHTLHFGTEFGSRKMIIANLFSSFVRRINYVNVCDSFVRLFVETWHTRKRSTIVIIRTHDSFVQFAKWPLSFSHISRDAFKCVDFDDRMANMNIVHCISEHTQ